MNKDELIFKKQTINQNIDLKKVENLGKRASDKIYGENVQIKNDKVIPFYTNMDTYVKLQQIVMSAKLNGNNDETSISKILRKALDMFIKERENNICP